MATATPTPDQDEEVGNVVPVGWPQAPLQDMDSADEGGADQTPADSDQQHHSQEPPLGRHEGFSQQPTRCHLIYRITTLLPSRMGLGRRVRRRERY